MVPKYLIIKMANEPDQLDQMAKNKTPSVQQYFGHPPKTLEPLRKKGGPQYQKVVPNNFSKGPSCFNNRLIKLKTQWADFRGGVF